jgi:hypothetical protein
LRALTRRFRPDRGLFCRFAWFFAGLPLFLWLQAPAELSLGV